MEELAMCRVCLAEDVRLRLIANTHLQEMYESLTLLPLETEDSRPIGVCYICLAGLQNCYQLRKRCLWSDELLTHMLSSVVLKPLNVQEGCTQRLTVKHPVIRLSIGDKLQNNIYDNATENSAHRTDAPDVLDRDTVQQQDNEVLTDIIIKMEPQEEYDAQLEDDIQCSLLEDPLDVTKREPDDFVTDNEDIQFVIEDIILEETDPNGAGSCSQIAYNICPKVAKVLFQRIEVNDTTTGARVSTESKIAALRDTEDAASSKRKTEVTNNTSLGHHVSSVSISNNKKNSCDICKKCFSRKKHLKTHILIHTGEKPHECHICKKRFIQKSDLTKHIRTHTGEKPYQCSLCKKRFNQNSNFKNHIRTHTGEKPYKCNYCNKCFSANSTLSDHIRLHTGEKPYQCSLCKKCFNQNSSFKNHIRKHTGEKPFQCHICKKCFNEKGSLKRHIHTHTGDKPY